MIYSFCKLPRPFQTQCRKGVAVVTTLDSIVEVEKVSELMLMLITMTRTRTMAVVMMTIALLPACRL